ncbi:MAG TPA: PIN domain-containing protein [Motilibacterales bacterium]|nr:PIN domain-containing protein [Motilibacterales bacterium]
MILVDTSIWVDHLRAGDQRLVGRLERSEVLTHPMVIGELALGSISPREILLDALSALPTSVAASAAEVMHLIETRRLNGRGIGLVDAHLLASVILTPDSRLWTRDRRLGVVARELGLIADDG